MLFNTLKGKKKKGDPSNEMKVDPSKWSTAYKGVAAQGGYSLVTKGIWLTGVGHCSLAARLPPRFIFNLRDLSAITNRN